MKRLLIQLCLFALPLLSALALLLVVICHSEMRILRTALKCQDNIRAVAVGDSRIAEHIDTEVNPWIRNCGIPGMTFSVTVRRAKLIVEENSNLQMLIVEVWPGSFYSDFNSPFPKYIPANVSLLELTNREYMPPFDERIMLRIANGLLKPGVKNIICRSEVTHLAGKFSKLNKTADPKTLLSYSRSEDSDDFKKPTGGEIMLVGLLEWMKQRGVNIVLVTMPLHRSNWEGHYSAEKREYFLRRMQEISRRYDIPWHNWMKDYQDAEYWYDSCHLNAKGASMFSREKISILEQHLQRCDLRKN